MKKKNFLEILEQITKRWHWLVSAMILGGLVGYGFATILPPVYESSAAFSVTIDYTQTGALTDVEEDQAMRGVGSVINSDQVATALLQELTAAGINLSEIDFKENASLDREEFHWTLRYRDPDPQTAFQVAEAWSQQADQVLKTALQHARMADSYQDVLTSLENCLQGVTEVYPLSNDCTLENMDLITEEMGKTSEQITGELKQSLGLFSALSVDLVDPANLPSAPVRRQRNVLVLSGAALGFLTGFFTLMISSQVRRKTVDE